MDSDPGSTAVDYHLCGRDSFGATTPSLEGLGHDNLLAARKRSPAEAGTGRA